MKLTPTAGNERFYRPIASQISGAFAVLGDPRTRGLLAIEIEDVSEKINNLTLPTFLERHKNLVVDAHTTLF